MVDSVGLVEGLPASALLQRALLDSAGVFATELKAADVPATAEAFRRTWTEALPRFEAARLASPDPLAVARRLAAAAAEQIQWHSLDGDRPLTAMLAASTTAPLPLQTCAGRGAAGWTPQFDWDGRIWSAAQFAELGAILQASQVISPAAQAALARVPSLLDDGRLNLTGRRIVVLGAGAEMAPTRLWLAAGADVLWLDVVPPPQAWLQAGDFAGRLFWPTPAADLLGDPAAVLATIRAFAHAGPLDLGLYAYAPGQARELRLTGAMNAIVEALPRALIASVTMLVSPTTPTALAPDDCTAMDHRLAARPGWEAGLAALRLLGQGSGRVTTGKGAATRTVVSIQGASYQWAQYLGKAMAALAWSQPAVPGARPLRVSANTAAITRTRSLDHPVFAAAFGGAGAFGVRTFTPQQSQRLNGLLAVHDWLADAQPVPGAVRVHGGIHTLPYPLEPALMIAAGIGFARAPRLLGGLLRRR